MRTLEQVQVQFKSKKFESYNNETEGVNYSVGIFGKRLAEYLQKSLPRYGVIVAGIFAEDWGWCIEIAHDEKYFLSIRCANINENESNNRFLCFINPDKPYIRKWFKKIDVRDNIKKVSNALNTILLEDPDIYDVSWDI